jgi:hypothetical protein
MTFTVLELVSPTELSIDVQNVPAGTFHVRTSTTLEGLFMPLAVPFDFDNTTEFPATITVDQGADPKAFFQVWSGAAPLVAPAPIAVDFDADGPSGFVASTFNPLGAGNTDGGWQHVNGTWEALGGQPGAPLEHHLTSPLLVLTEGGAVSLSVDHQYNFETDWDGGVVEVSVTGGPFEILTDFAQGGYDVALQAGADYGYEGDLNGVEAFNGNSGGVVTTVANAGTLNAGDVIQVRFRGMWDWNTLAPGGWVINSAEAIVTP